MPRNQRPGRFAVLFGGGSVAPFSPLDISGLAAWYDFSDITTLFTDSARTVPVTADGDVIGGVTDKSGSANHSTQVTSTAKPTYKTGIQNSLSAALGDGGDWLATAAFTELAQPNTIFVVVKNPSLVGTEHLFSGITALKRHIIYHEATAPGLTQWYAGTIINAGEIPPGDATIWGGNFASVYDCSRVP